MSGRSPREAQTNFLKPLRQAVDCFTTTPLLSPTVQAVWPQPDEDVPVSLGGSVRLAGDVRLYLRLDQWYRIVPGEGQRGKFKTTTVGYNYALRDVEDRFEIIGFHWHQSGPSPVTGYHMHLRKGARIGFTPLLDVHLPSGRVAIEDVLRLAVELGAAARPAHRHDWDKILTRTTAVYDRWRTR